MKFIHILTYIKYTANHNLETVHSHAIKKADLSVNVLALQHIILKYTRANICGKYMYETYRENKPPFTYSTPNDNLATISRVKH